MLSSGPEADEGALVPPAGRARVAGAGTTAATAIGGRGYPRSSPAPGGEEHRQPTLSVAAATPWARNQSVGILHAPPRLELDTTLLTLVLIDGHWFAPNDSDLTDFRQESEGFTQPRC